MGLDFLLWVQTLHTPFWDWFFRFITFFGDKIIVILVLTWFLWCRDREFGVKLGIVYFVGGMFNQIIKGIFTVSRPWVLEPRLIPETIIMDRAIGWSFTSAHTAAATALYGSLSLATKRVSLKLVCYLLILLTAISRLYLLVHTPQDVAGSLLIGVLLLALVWFYAAHEEFQRRFKIALMIGFGILLLTLGGIAIYRTVEGVNPAFLEGAFAALGAAIGYGIGWYLMAGRPYQEREHWYWQILKMVVGLSISFVLNAGIPALFGSHPLAILIGYALFTVWAVAGYPILIMWVKQRRIKGVA